MPGAGTGKRVRVAGAAPEFGVLWLAHKLRLVLAPVEEERKHSARAEHGRALDTRTLPVAASTCMVALFIHCATKTTVWACKRGREGVVYSQGSSPPSPLYIFKDAPPPCIFTRSVDRGGAAGFRGRVPPAVAGRLLLNAPLPQRLR